MYLGLHSVFLSSAQPNLRGYITFSKVDTYGVFSGISQVLRVKLAPTRSRFEEMFTRPVG